MIATRPLIAMPFQYALCLTEKQFKKTAKKLHVDITGVPFVNSGASATTHFFENKSAIVCMRPSNKRSQPQTYALLCHEAGHVYQHAVRILAEDRAGDEMMAYSIQGISQELFEIFEQSPPPHWRKKHGK